MTDVIERYLTLGLRLGRHVDGLVDAYYGPPELAAAVAAEALIDPGELAADADALAQSVAAAAGLDEQRRGWLGDQIRGLRTYAGVLAGERISYADEVERCYGVRPERGIASTSTARRTSGSSVSCRATEICAIVSKPGATSASSSPTAWFPL